MIRIKPKLIKTDLHHLHPLILMIYADMLWYCMRKYKIEPTISSMLRKKGQDSGVHETGRAMDISPRQYSMNGKIEEKLPLTECANIAAYFNVKYPRGDGKDTVMWHNGTGFHFHLQVGWDPCFSLQELENKQLVSDRDPFSGR